ncbi:MAG: F0F1 ATP synthase subunit delta [Actinobacteria bacterium]|nr:F0F1 ATP synthase subunit delta [Actinomycetota bacterium]
MFGSSRESLAALRAALQGRHSDPQLGAVAGELLAVAAVLSVEKALRVSLADAGTAAGSRTAVAQSVLGGKISETALAIVNEAIAVRWSHDADLVSAIETLGVQAACIAAQAAGSLDTVEEEVFMFGRAVAASSQLQMALTDPALPAGAKAEVVSNLLGGKSHAVTKQLLTHTVANLRGARIDSAVDALLAVAADQRQRLVAEVTTAVALTDGQMTRLHAALSTITGRDININVVVDRAVLGGIQVRIGDDLIDGTVSSRLEAASRSLKSE